jgi:hypothetical protein
MADEKTPTTAPKMEHYYHAEASALEGELIAPLKTPIKPQAYVKVHEDGGYLSERAIDYRLEGIFSFKKAYTQVSGHEDPKPERGYITLATSVIEGFNVLDVVTADRIVAQVVTRHEPDLDQLVPDVSFLGTRFENLQIAGHPVKCELELNLFGPKPTNKQPHSQGEFGAFAAKQREKLLSMSGLPSQVSDRYNQKPSDLKKAIECSLLPKAEGSFPWRPFGHVIDIPHFGKVYLAIVRLEEWDPHPDNGTPRSTLIKLTMVEVRMGCATNGNGLGGNTIANGGTKGTG